MLFPLPLHGTRSLARFGGPSEAVLETRTLTNLYNARPQWLRNAHAALDRAVWDAYGWDDPDPASVEEDTILARLLALNLERAGASDQSQRKGQELEAR